MADLNSHLTPSEVTIKRVNTLHHFVQLFNFDFLFISAEIGPAHTTQLLPRLPNNRPASRSLASFWDPPLISNVVEGVTAAAPLDDKDG